jgi:CheY-like chemotaxis protein
MELPKEILIVEDETITQRYLKNILEQYEINNIDCVDNAKDALLQLKTKTYEMILMDINIKGATDGIQTAREILNCWNIPIVFIPNFNLVRYCSYLRTGNPF